MKEPYAEGVATHGGPESCAAPREGDGEALTGVRVGWAIEPRDQGPEVPTPLTEAEGHIVGGAHREPLTDLARSKNLCMHGNSMRENREIPRSPAEMARWAAPGRPKAASR